MPRYARTRSETGIYHVMLKGIDDRDIFLEDDDRSKFLIQIMKAKDKGGFSLLAYCLMDNHIHLLMEKQKEEIGKTVQRITVGYVLWHNNKYGRKGHLFQNRFNSEPVESERYLLSVIRYIHQNPVKAGIVRHPGDFVWSSYQQFLAAYDHLAVIIDADRIKEYYITKEEFKEYMNAAQIEQCMECGRTKSFSDEELRGIILKDFGQLDQIQCLSPMERNRQIKAIHQKTNASIRQLGRVLKLGRGIVERGIK